LGFVIVNCDLSYACSGSNVVDNPEQFISMALPIRKLFAEDLFVIVSTLCSIKTFYTQEEIMPALSLKTVLNILDK
jgi:hypothetical protein